MYIGNLSSQNGTGHGGVNCCVRRVLSEKGWGEIEFGAGNGVNLSLKGFRNFSRGFFGNGSIVGHFTPTGVRLGTVASMNFNITKNVKI